MRKAMFGMVVLCGSMLMVGGCAKKDIVKQDEPIPAVAAPVSPPQTPKQAPAAPQPAKEETAQPLAIQGETVSMTAPAQAAPEVKSALEKIYFAFDSSTLSEQSRDTLYRNAEVIIKKSTAKYIVEGHCDERGSDEYNLALGERRAKAAYNYLLTLGVPADRLQSVSYGEERPAEQGHDETAWAQNRRAEFSIAK